jgi:hypothetical protein
MLRACNGQTKGLDQDNWPTKCQGKCLLGWILQGRTKGVSSPVPERSCPRKVWYGFRPRFRPNEYQLVSKTSVVQILREAQLLRIRVESRTNRVVSQFEVPARRDVRSASSFTSSSYGGFFPLLCSLM